MINCSKKITKLFDNPDYDSAETQTMTINVDGATTDDMEKLRKYYEAKAIHEVRKRGRHAKVKVVVLKSETRRRLGGAGGVIQITFIDESKTPAHSKTFDEEPNKPAQSEAGSTGKGNGSESPDWLRIALPIVLLVIAAAAWKWYTMRQARIAYENSRFCFFGFN